MWACFQPTFCASGESWLAQSGHLTAFWPLAICDNFAHDWSIFEDRDDRFVWAVGVFGAFLASIFLLLRKKLALPVFVVSLAAFLVSLLYTYVLTSGGAVMGQQMVITSAVIAGLLVFFSWYTRFMATRGVFH